MGVKKLQDYNIKWVDTHCHLDMLKGDPEQALQLGLSQGLDHVVTIGTNHQTNQEVLRFCEQFSSVSGSLGIHPHHATDATDADFDFIDHNLVHPKVLSVGECGLDYFYSFAEADDQKRVFITQLELAIKHDLPVVIHSRNAEKDTLDCLAQVDVGRLRGVFHSFTASMQMAEEVLDMGFHLSFNGICTFPKADAVREVLKRVPFDQLLLETDSPYLSPVPLRGKANVPGNVSLVGQFVADFLGQDVEQFAQQCYQNSQQLFCFANEG